METFTGLVVSAFWQNWLYDAYMPVAGIWQPRLNNFTFFFFYHCGNNDLSTLRTKWHLVGLTSPVTMMRTGIFSTTYKSHSTFSIMLLLTVGEEGDCRAITTTMAVAPVALTATADWKITSKAVKCHFYTLISCCSSNFTRPASLSYVHSACSLSLPLLFQPFSSSKSMTLIRKKQSWPTMRI